MGVHRTRGTKSLELAISRPRPEIAVAPAIRQRQMAEREQKDNFVHRLQITTKKALASLKRTQACYKWKFDSRLRPTRRFAAGDLVFL